MKNKLPIKASLTTKDGFHKCIDIEDLKQVLYIPCRTRVSLKVQIEPDLREPNFASFEQMEFYLEKHREVKQKNGLHHIVAVYKEY